MLAIGMAENVVIRSRKRSQLNLTSTNRSISI